PAVGLRVSESACVRICVCPNLRVSESECVRIQRRGRVSPLEKVRVLHAGIGHAKQPERAYLSDVGAVAAARVTAGAPGPQELSGQYGEPGGWIDVGRLSPSKRLLVLVEDLLASGMRERKPVRMGESERAIGDRFTGVFRCAVARPLHEYGPYALVLVRRKLGLRVQRQLRRATTTSARPLHGFLNGCSTTDALLGHGGLLGRSGPTNDLLGGGLPGRSSAADALLGYRSSADGSLFGRGLCYGGPDGC